MFAMTLESLVLRGVSVLSGGESVNLRLGTEYANGLQAPTVGHPMPHPMPCPALSALPAGGQPCCSSAAAERFADTFREDKRGRDETGRSRGHAGGVTARKSLSTSTRSAITGTGIRRSSNPARWLVAGKGLKAITPAARLTGSFAGNA
jgi:hypothetical protein